MGHTLKDFTVGQRVELHPRCDLWMRGARYGEVTKVDGRFVTVRLDKQPQRERKFFPNNLIPLQ